MNYELASQLVKEIIGEIRELKYAIKELTAQHKRLLDATGTPNATE
jgi:hypothetical protein